MQELRIVANCVVGLGFSSRGFREALRSEPHMIGCDAGSADTGPYFLGSGMTSKSKQTVKRDLEIMLMGARDKGIPLIIGSCGGAGSNENLNKTAEIVEEIAKENKLGFRIALIYAEQNKSYLKKRLAEGKITPLGPFPMLTEGDIDRSAHIVGMMGAEPYMRALDEGADVILAGRTVDPAIFAGFMLREGVKPATAWHAAKTIDKGYLVTTEPSQGSPILAFIKDDGFLVKPSLANAKCTTVTVSAMTMFENPDPYFIAQPSGMIDSTNCIYQQYDEKSVLVTGSSFIPATKYTIKIEGAELIGYRSISIAGIRDPILISQFSDFKSNFQNTMSKIIESLGIGSDEYRMRIIPYGINAVMGETDLNSDNIPKEIGLVIDVVARSQELADLIIGRANPTGSHTGFRGRLCTGGNFAYPFSPPLITIGQVYRWSAWHLVEPDNPYEMFEIVSDNV